MKLDPFQADALGGCLPCQSAGVTPVTSGSSALPAVVTVDPAKRDWIGIELKDQNGTPVPNEPFSVELADGTRLGGRLDNRGKIRLEGIDPGTCKISFPERDAGEWRAA